MKCNDRSQVPTVNRFMSLELGFMSDYSSRDIESMLLRHLEFCYVTVWYITCSVLPTRTQVNKCSIQYCIVYKAYSTARCINNSTIQTATSNTVQAAFILPHSLITRIPGSGPTANSNWTEGVSSTKVAAGDGNKIISKLWPFKPRFQTSVPSSKSFHADKMAGVSHGGEYSIVT